MKFLLPVLCLFRLAAAPDVSPRDDGETASYWEDSRIGSWAKYSTVHRIEGSPMPAHESTYKLTLKEVGGDEITLESVTEVRTAGETLEMPLQLVKQSRRSPLPFSTKGTKVLKRGWEEIPVAGRRLRCRRVDYLIDLGNAKSEGRVWTHPLVPGGMVRFTSTSTAGNLQVHSTMELLQFEKK